MKMYRDSFNIHEHIFSSPISNGCSELLWLNRYEYIWYSDYIIPSSVICHNYVLSGVTRYERKGSDKWSASLPLPERRNQWSWQTEAIKNEDLVHFVVTSGKHNFRFGQVKWNHKRPVNDLKLFVLVKVMVWGCSEASFQMQLSGK